ncbi:MAG: hypothetical protein Q7J32_13105 [Sphingomonadaceae bacterium]|nr:hypothetical protein [Sphingomonadaceae bacterium]
MAMLECYFDDSGTHGDSKIVTWGGLMGTSKQWDYLDKRWRKLLAEPLPGKPPLKQFHLSHCAALDGEFKDYKRGESDRLRYLFRQIIADAKLESYSFSVSTRDFDDLVRGRARDYFGSPERLAITGCLGRSLIRANELGHEFVSIILDQGRMSDEIRAYAKAVEDTYIGAAALVSIAAMKVGHWTPLQAADTVATEGYWSARTRLERGAPEYSPHLKSMLGKLEVMRGYIMERSHLEKLVRTYRVNPNKPLVVVPH